MILLLFPVLVKVPLAENTTPLLLIGKVFILYEPAVVTFANIVFVKPDADSPIFKYPVEFPSVYPDITALPPLVASPLIQRTA